MTYLAHAFVGIGVFLSIFIHPGTLAALHKDDSGLFNDTATSTWTSDIPMRLSESNQFPYWISTFFIVSTVNCYHQLLIPQPDLRTFEVNGAAAKDAHHVWVYCHELPGADPATFVPQFSQIQPYHSFFLSSAIDKSHAWVEWVDSMLPIQSADPVTFTYVGYTECGWYGSTFYYKDANHVYAESDVPASQAPDANQVSGQAAALLPSLPAETPIQTKGVVELVPWADPNTFQIVNPGKNNYGCLVGDKGHVEVQGFASNVLIDGADATTLAVINTPNNYQYEKDANHVYDSTGALIQGADPGTFALVPQTMTTTTTKKGKQIRVPETATINGQKVDAKDANHYYYQGKVVQ